MLCATRFSLSCKVMWKDIKTKIRRFFVADWYILEKVFRTITGLKFETLFLLLDCSSTRETDAFLHCQEKFL